MDTEDLPYGKNTHWVSKVQRRKSSPWGSWPFYQESGTKGSTGAPGRREGKPVVLGGSQWSSEEALAISFRWRRVAGENLTEAKRLNMIQKYVQYRANSYKKCHWKVKLLGNYNAKIRSLGFHPIRL